MQRMPSVKCPASGFKDARSGLTGQHVNHQLPKAFRTVSFNSRHTSSWVHRNKHHLGHSEIAQISVHFSLFFFFACLFYYSFCLIWSRSCFSDGSKHLKFDDIVTQSSPQNCTVYCGGIQTGLTGKCDFQLSDFVTLSSQHVGSLWTTFFSFRTLDATDLLTVWSNNGNPSFPRQRILLHQVVGVCCSVWPVGVTKSSVYQ